MSVWFCIPSKRPAPEAQACVDKWRAMGYKVAIWRDPGDQPVECDYCYWDKYPGYARAVNSLIHDVLEMDPECDWVVTGGDDTDPDPDKRAEEIANECAWHFGFERGVNSNTLMRNGRWVSTCGVMQPTGDRFAGGSIDRIAGSPWIGREFCQRTYGGNGPYWHEYHHMFVDEEIMQVALKLGVFWQRPDLTHLHHHFMRASDAIDSPAIHKPTPAHLKAANSPQHWERYAALYESRKAAGFPGALA